jgi:tetratricopeptide (TPR) repeat protein
MLRALFIKPMSAPVRWIESTSWELPFFNLPQRIPWPENVDPTEANKDPFPVEHLMEAIDALGAQAGEPWLMFRASADKLEELAEALEDSEIRRAAGLLDEYEQLRPGTSFGLFHRAYIARHEGRDDDAIDCYRKAAEKTPQVGAIWNNLATMHALRGQRDEAVKAFRQALQCNRNDPMALEGLAQLRELVKVKQADPQHPNAVAYVDHNTFRNLAGQQMQALAAQPDQLLAMGEELLRDGIAADVGLRALEQAAAARPGHPRTLLALGSAYRVHGQHDKARETLTRLTELHPQEPQAFFHLAQAHNAAGNADAERAALERVLELDPNFQPALGIRFGLSQSEHDPAKEDELARFGAEKKSWMAYLLASSVARERGDTRAALRQAERAVELNPESEEVLLHYAATLGDAKELGKLASVIRPAVESGKYSKRLDWNYAQVLRELGLLKDAIAVLRKAAEGEAPEDFKGMVHTTIDAWTGVLTGCGVRVETHSAGFLPRAVLISLPEGDGGIVVASGSQLPAQASFPWRATGEEASVAMQQGETGAAAEPRPLGAFRIRGVQGTTTGPTTIDCHVAVLPDGAMHFRATQAGRKLQVGWTHYSGKRPV